MAVLPVIGVLLAHLRRPVVDYGVEQQKLVDLDQEAVEEPVAGVVERAPLDGVLLAELVQNEDHGCDALPRDHGQELVQELIAYGLVQHREQDDHLETADDGHSGLDGEEEEVNVHLVDVFFVELSDQGRFGLFLFEI